MSQCFVVLVFAFTFISSLPTFVRCYATLNCIWLCVSVLSPHFVIPAFLLDGMYLLDGVPGDGISFKRILHYEYPGAVIKPLPTSVIQRIVHLM